MRLLLAAVLAVFAVQAQASTVLNSILIVYRNTETIRITPNDMKGSEHFLFFEYSLHGGPYINADQEIDFVYISREMNGGDDPLWIGYPQLGEFFNWLYVTDYRYRVVATDVFASTVPIPAGIMLPSALMVLIAARRRFRRSPERHPPR